MELKIRENLCQHLHCTKRSAVQVSVAKDFDHV